MNVRNAQNLSMLCDFYELTMSNGYFRNGYKDRITYFDLFFRQVPDGGGFAIAAGLEQVVEYITNLHFSDEDIDYLRSRGIFCEEFLQYLRDFRFTGDIWAVPEGTPGVPARAAHYGARPRDRGAARGDVSPARGEPPVAHRNEGEPASSVPRGAAR